MPLTAATEFDFAGIPCDYRLKSLIVCDATTEQFLAHARRSSLPKLYIRNVNYPLDAITTFLRDKPVDIMHVICMGRKGAIKLGNCWLTTDTLRENSLLISQWHVQKIALWSNETGAYCDFTQTLAKLSRAEVFCTSCESIEYNKDSNFVLHSNLGSMNINSPYDVENPKILAAVN